MWRVCVGVWLCACASPQLPEPLVAAQAKEAKDPDGALAAYRGLLDGCTLPKDDCATARIREAELLETMGRVDSSVAAWLAVKSMQPERMARATARAAHLLVERDPARAETLAEKALRAWPNEVATDDALKTWVRLLEQHRHLSPPAIAVQLRALFPSVAATDLGDNVLFLVAELQAKDSPSDAVRTWDYLVERYRRSPLRDDALWRAAEILRRSGLPQEALTRLQTIVDSRRDALITGSYNSIWLDDAQLLIGRINLEDLGDLDAAERAFRALADDYHESVLQDDGLYFLAQTQRRRDPVEACATLRRLLTRFPDSNQRRAAETELVACP